jgi:molybdopterin synthase sulfur carrier subunit
VTAMTVRLLYFAGLRERLGTGGEDLLLPAGVDTVATLRAHLIAREGAWREALAGNAALRVAVNQDMANAQTVVKAGDEVAFFPPVTGG